MIYLSLYYFIGGAVFLPTITFFTTKWWYDKKILAIESSHIEDTMSPNSIEDAEELCPSTFSFDNKKSILEQQLFKQ